MSKDPDYSDIPEGEDRNAAANIARLEALKKSPPKVKDEPKKPDGAPAGSGKS